MNERVKYMVQFVVGTVIVVYAAFVYAVSRSISRAAMDGTALATQVASASVMVALIGLWLWEQLIWKLPVIQRLPGVTRCIAGTWKGSLDPFWVDPESGSRIGPVKAYLCVQQRASATFVTLHTERSRSKEFVAIVSKREDDSWSLVEVYENRPRLAVQDTSRSHLGAMVLEISGNPARHLEGHYWTDRNTAGELVFSAWKKARVDRFADAEALFMVT